MAGGKSKNNTKAPNNSQGAAVPTLMPSIMVEPPAGETNLNTEAQETEPLNTPLVTDAVEH